VSQLSGTLREIVTCAALRRDYSPKVPLRNHACADCGTQVPPIDDESALISMKYGWRLTRKVQSDGTSLLEWRCPKCWARFRESRRAPERREDGGT
jgi:DNA-directed RNA polymerase subunit RPC12/RpoP